MCLRGFFGGWQSDWRFFHDLGRALQIVECKLQLRECLVHALGRATELPALQARDLGHQLGDQFIAAE
jgi:hypothetical protein